MTGEEVELEVENVALLDLWLFTMLSLFLAMDVGEDVDIHDEGIVREDMVHDVVGEGADLMVEDRVPAFAFFHLPVDEVHLPADEIVGGDVESEVFDFEAGT